MINIDQPHGDARGSEYCIHHLHMPNGVGGEGFKTFKFNYIYLKVLDRSFSHRSSKDCIISPLTVYAPRDCLHTNQQGVQIVRKTKMNELAQLKRIFGISTISEVPPGTLRLISKYTTQPFYVAFFGCNLIKHSTQFSFCFPSRLGMITTAIKQHLSTCD